MPRTRRNETIVNFILDGSGSMRSRAHDAIAGFNAYMDELRDSQQAVGDNVKVSLTVFNTEAEVRFANVPVADVPYLDDKTYVPNGWTALYDAIGLTVHAVKHSLRRRRNMPKVLFVILTDGRETGHSTKFNRESIRKLVTECQAEGNYTFTYLGAGQEAFLAQEIAIPVGNTLSYDANRVGETMNRLSVGTRSYRSGLAPSTTAFWAGETREPVSDEDIPSRIRRIVNER